ncbi:MAG: ABC transporter permease subunit [Clostridiales bacterium]|nr:ABC transporter permease subunit [Clostridiales bacterium]
MKNKGSLYRVLAIAFALGLWQLISYLVGQRLLIVSPVEVLLRLGTIWMEPGFWRTVFFSFTRIISGFLIALITGFFLALLSGKFRFFEMMLRPFVVTIKSVPVASFIIISLIWLSARELSIFISFLMVFPVVYMNVLQGIKIVDRKLVEMAKVFDVGWNRSLLRVYMPSIKPFLISACGVGFGMSWKAGVAAEVIGIPKGSIGERLYEAKIYLNTSDLFAWTVVIVLISVVFEKLFLRLLRAGFGGLEKL